MAAAAHLPLLPISLKVIECVCSHSGVRSPLRKESDFTAIAQGSAQDFYGGRANFKQNLCCLSHRGGPLLSKLPRDPNSTLHSGASPRGNPPTEIAINHPHGSSGQGTPPRHHDNNSGSGVHNNPNQASAPPTKSGETPPSPPKPPRDAHGRWGAGSDALLWSITHSAKAVWPLGSSSPWSWVRK